MIHLKKTGSASFLTFICLFGFTSLSVVFAQSEEEPSTAPIGRIAYIGSDLNVYSLDLESELSVPMTTDALVQNSARTLRFYSWPTWSQDNRLAYFANEYALNGDNSLEVFISSDGVAEGERAFSFQDTALTYAQWAPQNCTIDSRCRDLALLLSRPNQAGFSVELMRNLADKTERIRTGIGVPFYFSWSPDGTRMLRHRDGTLIDLYSVVDETVETVISNRAGTFGAPAWSPVDDRLLFTTRDDEMVIQSGDNAPQVLVNNLRGATAFAWSHNGNLVAYTNSLGAVIVRDSVSGDIISQSPVEGVLAFFWSPDSSKIAYITATTSLDDFNARDTNSAPHLAAMIQTSPQIAWSVLDVLTGENRRYGAFTPTPDLTYLLSYFDQFSVSHRLWSPDSRHLVYSEVTNNDRSVISILDVMRSIAVPFIVADGEIGIWSFQ